MTTMRPTRRQFVGGSLGASALGVAGSAHGRGARPAAPPPPLNGSPRDDFYFSTRTSWNSRWLVSIAA